MASDKKSLRNVSSIWFACLRVLTAVTVGSDYLKKNSQVLKTDFTQIFEI